MSDHLQYALNVHTGYSGFPNIYLGKFHVGGYNDFITYFNSKETLKKILSEHCSHLRHD